MQNTDKYESSEIKYYQDYLEDHNLYCFYLYQYAFCIFY